MGNYYSNSNHNSENANSATINHPKYGSLTLSPNFNKDSTELIYHLKYGTLSADDIFDYESLKLDYLIESSDVGSQQQMYISIIHDVFNREVIGLKVHQSFQHDESSQHLEQYRKLHPNVNTYTIQNGLWYPIKTRGPSGIEEDNKSDQYNLNRAAKRLHDEYLKSIEETDKKYNEYIIAFNKLNNIE